VLPGGDQRPGLRLKIGRPAEAFQEPFGDQRVEEISENFIRWIRSDLMHRLFHTTAVIFGKKQARRFVFSYLIPVLPRYLEL
jgi:hypothetical protein